MQKKSIYKYTTYSDFEGAIYILQTMLDGKTGIRCIMDRISEGGMC